MEEPNINPFAGLSPLSQQFGDPQPVLVICLVDHIIPSNVTEFNPSGKQWEHGLRQIHKITGGKTGYWHEYASPSEGEQSKLSLYLKGMRAALRPEDMLRLESAGGIGNNALVGSVFWALRTTKKFGTNESTMTLGLKRATDEEVVDAVTWNAQNPIQVTDQTQLSSGGLGAGGLGAAVRSIEWTDERIESVRNLLVGRTRIEVFSLLDQLGPDQELRGAVVSGTAANFLVEAELAVFDEAGNLQAPQEIGESEAAGARRSRG